MTYRLGIDVGGTYTDLFLFDDKIGASHKTKVPTAALRRKMKKARGKVKVFDYGPDVETLRKNCLKETGLPAPKQPVWKKKAKKVAS